MQFSDLDLTKTYSYADYLQWDFEERVELIKGKVFQFLETSSTTSHQRVLWILSGELYNYFKGKKAVAYTVPFDVRLFLSNDNSSDTVVQPDLCIITDLSKIDDNGCNGSPNIAIEILSPGNNQKDLHYKFDTYEEAKIKEYWILSPQNKYFLRYVLNAAGKYQSSRMLTIGDKIETPILPGFSLDLETVFADIP